MNQEIKKKGKSELLEEIKNFGKEELENVLKKLNQTPKKLEIEPELAVQISSILEKVKQKLMTDISVGELEKVDYQINFLFRNGKKVDELGSKVKVVQIW